MTDERQLYAEAHAALDMLELILYVDGREDTPTGPTLLPLSGPNFQEEE